MRYEKGSFTTVPNMKKIMGCAPYVQSVYLWLCHHANQEGTCFPSFATLAKESGASRRGVINAIQILEKKGILLKEGRVEDKENLSNIYTITIGGSEPDALGVVHTMHQGSAYHALGVVHNSTTNYTHTNQTHLTKENKQSFSVFWDLYPLKVQKKKAEEKWNKLPESVQKLILEDIPRRMSSDAWKKNFVPHPTTYLNGERWNDEIVILSPIGNPVDRFLI